MPDTIERQIAMLRAVPREPIRRTVQQIVQRLAADGHVVTARTVQRDLNSLSRLFGIVCDTEGRTQFWYYPRTSKGLDIPGMGSAEALVFRMAEVHLRDALPATLVEHLRPYFEQARAVIEREDVPLNRWRSRVRMIGWGPSLTMPTIRRGVLEAVHDAFLQGRRLSIQYQRRGESKVREYQANVLALVIRDGIVYAVVTLWDYDDVIHLALHRATSASVLDARAKTVKDFDIDDYIGRQAVFSYPKDPKPISLVIDINEHVYNHLSERHLSADQKIVDHGVGTWRLTAKVADTNELYWWLLGFGDAIKVQKPVSLQRRIIESLQNSLMRYEDVVRGGNDLKRP